MSRNSEAFRRGEIVGGKYEILKEIGQGGMSTVYLVMDTRLKKNWAMKEVMKEGRNAADSYEMLRSSLLVEAEMLKKLSHPRLPRIVDLIETEDYFCVVMDYIEGRTLAEVLREEGAQPQERVIRWAKQLAEVLYYLHTCDPPVIYRDMKPDNIMLKPDGDIVLFDFGIAREYKHFRPGDTHSLGTFGYAAPEQFGGRGQTGPETDIFSLGTTLYHLVTGRDPAQPPYGVRPIREIDPGLSPGLERILLKCTRRDPEERYRDCAELLYALEHYDAVDENCRKMAKRKMAAFLAPLTAGLIGILVMAGGIAGQKAQKREQYAKMLTRCSDLAVESLLRGEYRQDVLAAYTETIDFDPSRAEGYTGLLRYCAQTGKTQAGLATVCARIDAGAGRIDRCNEVLLAVAELYFAGNKSDRAFSADYAKAARYYALADTVKNPEAAYFGQIAEALGTFGEGVDWENVSGALEVFSRYIDRQKPEIARIREYQLAAGIYLANKWAFDGTGEDPCGKAAVLLKKALRCVELLEEETAEDPSKRRGFAGGGFFFGETLSEEDSRAELEECRMQLLSDLAACERLTAET